MNKIGKNGRVSQTADYIPFKEACKTLKIKPIVGNFAHFSEWVIRTNKFGDRKIFVSPECIENLKKIRGI